MPLGAEDGGSAERTATANQTGLDLIAAIQFDNDGDQARAGKNELGDRRVRFSENVPLHEVERLQTLSKVRRSAAGQCLKKVVAEHDKTLPSCEKVFAVLSAERKRLLPAFRLKRLIIVGLLFRRAALTSRMRLF
jgi:hypothetical protein